MSDPLYAVGIITLFDNWEPFLGIYNVNVVKLKEEDADSLEVLHGLNFAGEVKFDRVWAKDGTLDTLAVWNESQRTDFLNESGYKVKGSWANHKVAELPGNIVSSIEVEKI